MKKDTIAAIATAMTNSGIGIVRISGPEVFDIVQKNTRMHQNKSHILQKANESSA